MLNTGLFMVLCFHILISKHNTNSPSKYSIFSKQIKIQKASLPIKIPA